MIELLSNEIIEKSPKVTSISEKEQNRYRLGLSAIAYVLDENFIDIERINLGHKYAKEGLFYEIPFYDSDVLWSDNKLMLMCIYRIKNKSSYCPISISINKEGPLEVKVHYQGNFRSNSVLLIGNLKVDEGAYSTSFIDVEHLSLKSLAEVSESIK